MLGSKTSGSSGSGTVVGANVKLVGTLQDGNDITIHGNIEGEVISNQSVTITESAFVKGPVSANVVTVAGKVKGSITCTGKMEIMPTGKVFGSITTKDLSIKSGAIFIGKCSMPEQEATEPPEEKIVEGENPKEESKEAPKEETTYEVD